MDLLIAETAALKVYKKGRQGGEKEKAREKVKTYMCVKNGWKARANGANEES